jgi:hypothetical protein
LWWGNYVHTQLEHAVRDGTPLADNVKQYSKLVAKLRAAPGVKYCEIQTAVTIEGKACGFFDSNCWNRGKDDLIIINGNKAVDIDYKTGKEGKLSPQLAQSAARVMARYPEVTEVTTAYAWLATGKWTRAKYVRDNITKIWDEVREDIAQMQWSEQHNTWPAKPSGLCKRSRKPGSTYQGCPVMNCPHSENFRRGT